MPVVFKPNRKETDFMKKLLAVILAVITAFSCSAIAFAVEIPVSYTQHINGEGYMCPECGKVFTDYNAYNAHLDEEDAAALEAKKNTPFFDLQASGIVSRLIHVFKTETSWWDEVESIIIRLVDLVENLMTGGKAEADVAGAISDLEAKVASLPIIGEVLSTIKSLITSLKQKIKDFYSGNKETAVEETAAVAPSDTGSSAAGIAVFAAMSVAAAAAFVCTRKKSA